MKPRVYLLSTITVALIAMPAHAQGWMSMDGAMNLSIGAGNYLLSREVLKYANPSGSSSASKDTAVKPVSSTFAYKSSVHPGIDQLLKNYPAAQRPTVQKNLLTTLDIYHQTVKNLGAKNYDVGTALAAFMAGTFAGYNNQTFPTTFFNPMAQRFQTALSNDRSFAALNDLKKQEIYEQLAIVGMILTLSQLEVQKQPNAQTAAQMKQVSQRYLQQVFKLDASRMELGSQGLVIKN